MKFSQKIVAASSALLLVIVVLLSLQQLATVRSEVQSLVQNSLKEMVLGVKNTISSEMSSKKGLAKAMTESLELDPTNRQYVQDVLEKPTLKGSFLSIGLGYEADGSMIENDDNWSPDSSYDPRQRPWYTGAKNQQSLIVTAPYVDAATKNMIISIGTPVRSRGQFIGSMFYDLELTKLATLVNGINLFDAGYLFIVTAEGTTIAHPDVNNNGQPLSSYLPQITLSEGIQQIELEGQPHLAYFSQVPNENWYVGAVIDESLAFSTLSTLRNSSIIYTLIGVILSVIGLSVLIKVLMRPLGLLNDAIQDMASGQGDLTKRLNTNTDKEFAELAYGFNAFTETLQKQIQQSKAIGEEIM